MASRSSTLAPSPARSPASPNNALQRTEAGGRLFLAIHALLRQPLSLSLEALGDSTVTIRLSKQEQQMLASTVQMPDSLRAVVRSALPVGESWRLELAAPVAEQIRDCCADTLLQISFDEHYEPTKEGHILEALIDRFFPHPPPVA